MHSISHPNYVYRPRSVEQRAAQAAASRVRRGIPLDCCQVYGSTIKQNIADILRPMLYTVANEHSRSIAEILAAQNWTVESADAVVTKFFQERQTRKQVADRGWRKAASLFLKHKLRECDITYTELAKRLKNHGIPPESEVSISDKFERYAFNATFFLACVAALELNPKEVQIKRLSAPTVKHNRETRRLLHLEQRRSTELALMALDVAMIRNLK